MESEKVAAVLLEGLEGLSYLSSGQMVVGGLAGVGAMTEDPRCSPMMMTLLRCMQSLPAIHNSLESSRYLGSVESGVPMLTGHYICLWDCPN